MQYPRLYVKLLKLKHHKEKAGKVTTPYRLETLTPLQVPMVLKYRTPMTTTKTGGYSSFKKTTTKKDEKPKRDILFYPANFIVKLPLHISIALIMFERSYQLQGTDAYYIYFSRTGPKFREMLSDAGLEVSKRNFYYLLKKLPELGWNPIPNPTEGDERLVWRYDKRAPLALYTAFSIEPRSCMVLQEGLTVEDTIAFGELIEGYPSYDDALPDILRDEKSSRKSVSPPAGFELELA